MPLIALLLLLLLPSSARADEPASPAGAEEPKVAPVAPPPLEDACDANCRSYDERMRACFEKDYVDILPACRASCSARPALAEPCLTCVADEKQCSRIRDDVCGRACLPWRRAAFEGPPAPDAALRSFLLGLGARCDGRPCLSPGLPHPTPKEQ